MYFKIETRPPGGAGRDWAETPFTNSEANCYETAGEAEAEITVLQAGTEAEYRVVPITNGRETITFSFERADVELIRAALWSFRRRSRRVDQITALLAAIEDPR